MSDAMRIVLINGEVDAPEYTMETGTLKGFLKWCSDHAPLSNEEIGALRSLAVGETFHAPAVHGFNAWRIERLPDDETIP